MAHRVGITERAVQWIMADLEEGGYPLARWAAKSRPKCTWTAHASTAGRSGLLEGISQPRSPSRAMSPGLEPLDTPFSQGFAPSSRPRPGTGERPGSVRPSGLRSSQRRGDRFLTPSSPGSTRWVSSPHSPLAGGRSRPPKATAPRTGCPPRSPCSGSASARSRSLPRRRRLRRGRGGGGAAGGFDGGVFGPILAERARHACGWWRGWGEGRRVGEGR
jgi:hypothetical protein